MHTCVYKRLHIVYRWMCAHICHSFDVCACVLLLCSACRARRSHRAPARAEDNTALAECAWCLQRLARPRGRRRCSDRKACCGFEGQLQLDAARGSARVVLPAMARMTQCAAQLDLHCQRARRILFRVAKRCKKRTRFRYHFLVSERASRLCRALLRICATTCNDARGVASRAARYARPARTL